MFKGETRAVWTGALARARARNYGSISLQNLAGSSGELRPAMKSSSETLNYAGECGEVMAVWINLDLRAGRFERGAAF